VVVLAIDDQHVDGRVGERARDAESAEAGADDQHALAHAVGSDGAQPHLAQRGYDREREQRRHERVQARHLDGQTELHVRDAE